VPGRVLVVAPEPFYADRGTPIALRQLLEALGQLSYAADLVTYPFGMDVEIPGLSIFRARNPFRIRHVPVGFSVRKVLLDCTLIARLRARLKAARYLCVHAVEEAAFPAVFLARWAGLPLVYDMQSSLPEQLTEHWVFRGRAAQAALHRCERWLLENVDLVASSSGLSERVRRIAPGTRVREWRYSGLLARPQAREVAALRSELSISAGSPVVVYAGTFENYQGLADLLAAVPLVLAELPETVFVLVGNEGTRGRELLGRTPGFLKAGAVRLIDRQPRHRVPAFLALADVLVSPRALGGNLPLKIFDYLSAGRPIVATDIPTHRTLLDETRAVLVRPAADEIAQAITTLFRDPERAARLAAAASAYAQNTLGWETFVRSVDELYKEMRAISHTRAHNG
jgi:glycosyltransferase involved in cell wall biosynthesis